jgi:DNA-binding LytR/AlgR family response regulator
MESQLRHTIVYLKSGDTIVLHKKLEDVWSEARCHKAFARCHKSFVVNLDNAIQLENHAFRLVNGAEIPISRSAYPESKADYYRHKVMAGNRT